MLIQQTKWDTEIHSSGVHSFTQTPRSERSEPPKTTKNRQKQKSRLRVVMLVSRVDKAANRQTPTGSHDARQKQTGSSDSDQQIHQV